MIQSSKYGNFVALLMPVSVFAVGVSLIHPENLLNLP